MSLIKGSQFLLHVHCTVLTRLTCKKIKSVVVLQGELTVCESPVVKLIGYDGDITQRKLGESHAYLNGVRK